MPYIDGERRIALSLSPTDEPQSAGELNFLFYTIAMDYWRRRHNYQAANDIIGALEGAKLEFYRRRVSFYEDEKIKQNGDIH